MSSRLICCLLLVAYYITLVSSFGVDLKSAQEVPGPNSDVQVIWFHTGSTDQNNGVSVVLLGPGNYNQTKSIPPEEANNTSGSMTFQTAQPGPYQIFVNGPNNAQLASKSFQVVASDLNSFINQPESTTTTTTTPGGSETTLNQPESTTTTTTTTGGSETTSKQGQSETSTSSPSETTTASNTKTSSSPGETSSINTSSASQSNITAAPSSPSSVPSSIAPIVGGTVGGIVLCVLVFVLVCWYRSRRHRKRPILSVQLDRESRSDSAFNIQPYDLKSVFVHATPIFGKPQPSNTPSPVVSPSPATLAAISGPSDTSPASPLSNSVASPTNPALESTDVESNGSEGSSVPVKDLRRRLRELRAEVKHWQSLAVPPAYTDPEQTLNEL